MWRRHEKAAEQAEVAARLVASLRRRFGDDWQNGMDARSKQLRRMKARVRDLEQQLARSLAQQAISGAAATKLEAQLTELEREKQQLCDEAQLAIKTLQHGDQLRSIVPAGERLHRRRAGSSWHL